MSNTMSKLIREKMYYCFIYRRAFFLSFFFFKFNTLSINFTISKLSFHSIFGFKYELLSLFNIWKNTIIPVTIRWQCWLYLFAWLYYGKFKINIKLHGTNVITFLPLHFFLRSNYTHLYSILIPLGSSIYILRQSLTPLFHFRERFPFIKSTGTLDEETGRTGLKRKDWQLSKYRRWQTRSFLKTFDSNNKFSSDKTNAARSNYSQDVEYLFQKRPLSFFLFFFFHPLILYQRLLFRPICYNSSRNLFFFASLHCCGFSRWFRKKKQYIPFIAESVVICAGNRLPLLIIEAFVREEIKNCTS